MILKDQYEQLREDLRVINESSSLNGSDAKRSENLHRLFFYPAMMVPVTQNRLIEVLSKVLPKQAWAFDPFMGSGTSLLSCMEFGYNVFGQDINPLSVLIVKAKTTTYDIEALKVSFSQLVHCVQEDNSEIVDVHFSGMDKWFPKETQIILSRIRRAIIDIDIKDYRYFFWVVMAETIRIGSNDRTSTFKLHQRSADELTHRHVDIFKTFCDLTKRCFEDLQLFKDKLYKKGLIESNHFKSNIMVQWGNSTDEIHAPVKFDLLVSSPPYGDNHTTVTYGQHSYLELQWIDSKDLESDEQFDFLKNAQAIDSASLGGHNSKVLFIQQLEEIKKHVPSLWTFMQTIPEDEKFKYTKTVSFVLDFEKSLKQIVPSMKDNAFYVWTIGNRNVGGREIPNDEILVDIMNELGVKHFYTAERQILNKQQPKKNNFSKTMEKEKILIFHNEKN